MISPYFKFKKSIIKKIQEIIYISDATLRCDPAGTSLEYDTMRLRNFIDIHVAIERLIR